MELNIYNKEGQLKATASPTDSSTLTEGLMTDYILNLSFVLFDCVQLDVNDYVDFLGKRYWMLEAYLPNQKSTIEWNYNTKFYGIESVIRRALCLKTVDNEMNAVFSLTDAAIEHVRLVVGNINRVMGTTDWKVGEVEATVNLTIDYNATYCDAALASIATAADTEYWIDGLTVNLCRCEHGELLSLGYENGLKEITLDTNENAKFFTRLFPLGSTRNIDASKYGSGRLHLPGGVKYVEQNTHYGIIEHSEEAAFSDIYPRRVGKVGVVRHETKKGEDGKDFDIYYFTDPDIDFDPNKYEIGGLIKSIVFETGDLAGRDFEVNYNAEKKEFEVVTQWPYGDEMQLPGALVMKPGNDYILYNITMPTEYYPKAEAEFATAVASYMEKNKRDKSVYKAPTDYIDLNERGIVLTVGQRVHLMSDKYFPAVGYRDSRITKITRKVNETLQADIEISDLANPGGKAVLTQGISEAKHYAQVAMAGLPDMIKSWENTPASDSNLYTSKKTDKEIRNRAISRQYDDSTDGHITFNNGLLVKSPLNVRQLKTVMSDALTEEGDENEEMMGFSLIEEGDGNEELMSTSLSEVALDGGFGGGTLGELDNTDELFDTCPDGIYSLQKKAGVYYPVKGGGSSSSKMTLSFVSTSTPVFAFGRTAIVRYRFTSIFDGETTGSGNVTYTVNGKQIASSTIEQGECSFDAGKYLVLGDNILVVAATDAYGTVRKLTYNISTVSISASSTFDDSKPYSGAISFVYTPMGAIIKTVHFVVDGAEIGTEVTAISNRQLTYSIPAQEHGAHSLEVYITAEIDGVTIESNRLHYALICTASGNMTPIIASSFTQKQAEQFSTLLIPYIVYNPAASMSSVTLSANGETISTQSVDRTGQSWSYRADDSGELTLTISCGGVAKSFQLTVSESAVDVHPETADLVLFLTSVNRSNNEEGRTVWSYGELYAVLTAFNWATNGWVKTFEGFTALRASGDARVIIPYYAFADDFRSTGKTIEFEFETRDVMDYEAVVLSCMVGGIGLEVTAQKAVFRSEQSKVETQFKEDERVRVAFVVEKRAENRLIYVYVNGEMCGVIRYPEQDNFMQSTPAGITIGNNDCTVDTFNIRIYDNNLNRYQLLDNYIGDMDSLELKRSLFARNQIYDAYGNVSYDKLLDYVPILTIIGALPAYKGDKVTCAMEYEDRQTPSRCWTCAKAQNDVQGTSSQYYPRKNYKFKFKGDILIGGITANKFPIRDGDIAVDCFCVKADFAESSGCHNTGLARMVDFVLRGLGQLTPPQKTDRRVRTTIDGYPIVIFHKQTADAPATFLGKYNFNNDKSTQETFGFTAGCECWELKNNTSDRVKFLASDYTSVDAAGNPDWLNDFEARYPDDDDLNAEYEGGKIPVNLKRLTDWLVSVKGNPTRFKSEASGYLDIPFLLSYYTLTEFFGMVDQRAKNMFLTTYDGTHWIPIFYDNDTCLGINNEGVNAFDYTIEYHDKIGTQDVWNGEASSLWNNVESAYNDEVSAIYADMRKNNLLTYEECNRFLNTEQGDRWSESVYNEDSYYKYIRPLLDEGNGSYLYAAQGSRRMHRIWWLHNRFKYMDSKYVAGDFKNDYATMRLYTPTAWAGVKPNADITITSYSGQYVSVKYGSYVVGGRTKKNVPHRVVAPDIQFNDTETIIYGASQISNLGDLSALYAGTIDVSKMSKLTELIAGSGALGYRNTNLEVLSVGANDLLRKLDVRGCPNLHQPIDVSRCANIREVWAEGTGTTAVVLPEGGSLSLLHLPETITNLTVRNQPNLAEDGLMIAGVQNLTTIRLENTNGIDSASLINRCLANSTSTLERVRLIGVDWYLNSLDTLIKLSKLKGLNANGMNTAKSVVTGKCHVLLATSIKLAEVKAAFPELTVTYTQLKPETATTFVFGSSRGKSITNAVFECNFDFTKVNEYTYKITAQDNETITFTFKCDNHVDYSNSYLVAGTRTQNYSVTYIPLRTIRVKVYNQSLYPQGATVVVNGKKLISDANGYVTYRGGEAINGTVEAFGYAGSTFSFSAITNDTTNTVEVYAAVEIKFAVSKQIGGAFIQGAIVMCGNDQASTNLYGECILLLSKGTYEYKVICASYLQKTGNISVDTSGYTERVYMDPAKVDLRFVAKDAEKALIDGATVTCNGVTGVTDANGECVFSVDSCQTHSYTMVKYGYFDYTGEVEVSIYTKTEDVVLKLNAEAYRPEENGNIQMLLKGADATLAIESTTADYVIDWGDGAIDNASGIGSRVYTHTYSTPAYYQVEIKNCNNISGCNGSDTCLIAYWSIGSSKVTGLSFYGFKRLLHVGLVFRNDTHRTKFNNCFYYCDSLTNIPAGLFDNCTAVTDFYGCFNSCYNLTSIPSGLFDNCTAVTNFGNCFGGCKNLTNIPSGLFDNCTAVTDFYYCFGSCANLTRITEGLFDKCTAVTSFSQCFYYCYSLTNIPVGLFDNCTAVTHFNSCFYHCDSLTNIPVGLFDNCTAVTDFDSCFGSCKSLTNIPSGLFDNCTAVTDFSQCFLDCKKIISTLPQLWAQYYGKTVNKVNCFLGCYSAANWSEVPVSWGGTAPEYVPPIQIGGVMMADYRALEARVRNIELQQNMDKN